MKFSIAIVHNNYARSSGEEAVIENLSALLAGRGVSVCRFNRFSAEIEDKLSGKMAAFFSGINNPFAAKEFAVFLKSNRPDVVHIHNLYPLISPSILPVCKAFGVPLVMTVHNFRLVCPNGLLLCRGEICHRCLGGWEYWCVLRNCENSVFKSMGYALRTATARIMRRYYDNVDHFICLSEFQKNILVGEGLPVGRVSVLANPVSLSGTLGDKKGMDTGLRRYDEKVEHSGMTESRKISPSGRNDRGVGRNDIKISFDTGSPTSPFGDDRGMDPPAFAGLRRQVHSRMTESRKISPSGRNDMNKNYDTTAAGMTVGGSPIGPFGDDIVAGMGVHPPSIPPVKGGKYADDGHYVAYVGRISPEKDIFTLLEAARRLGDVAFKFAGDYHRMPEVLKNKPMNVEFLGQLGAKEIVEFYCNAQMVVFATRCYEGFPTVLLEAMSHGLPIVCSRIGGLPEIIEEGANGLLYAPGNVEELTARIQTLWEDAALCEKLGEEGRRRFSENYNVEKLVDGIIGVYEKVMKKAEGV